MLGSWDAISVSSTSERRIVVGIHLPTEFVEKHVDLAWRIDRWRREVFDAK